MAEAVKGVEEKSAIEKMKDWPREVKEYIEGLRAEMRRVTWPSKKQVQATTAVVIITVFAFAAFFAVVDAILARAIAGVQAVFTK